MSNEEEIKGCIKRIEDAKIQVSDEEIYIAMDGILNKVCDKYFICGWTAIYDRKTDNYSYGCSSQIQVPKVIIDKLTSDVRLSDIATNYYGSAEEEIRNYGTNGILTNGCYTRTNEFTDSVLCAMSSKYLKLKK